MREALKKIAVVAAIVPLLAGCAQAVEAELTDETPAIEFAPQGVGFSSEIPEGWEVDEGNTASKDSCTMVTSINTVTHTGMDLGDDSVANAAFLSRYAYEVLPDSASLSRMTVNDALGEELQFLVYQFDREMVTIAPDNNNDEYPDTIKQNVRSFIAMRGVSQAVETYRPDDPENKEGRKAVNPVLTVEGYCEDPADYSPDTMEAVAASAVFAQGIDPREDEALQEETEETP